MLNNLLEFAGFVCLVAFAFLLWPPAALLVAGVGLVAAGVAGDFGGRRPDRRGS